jgi:hypothetical protein
MEWRVDKGNLDSERRQLNRILDEIQASIGGLPGGVVETIVPGTGIEVDSTDAANPEVALDAATISDLALAASSVQPGDNVSVLVNDAGYTTNTGTVTSVAVTGTDGIEVDSGSPVTTAGTIQLGLDAATLGKLADAASAVQPGDNISTLTNDAGYTTNIGTVTSVNLANSTGLTASGGPITGSGSLTYTLSANLQAWHGLATSAKLDTSAYTAADVFSKVLTLDGAGSGLDADLLDGQQGAYYLSASSYTAADVLSKLLTVDGAGSGLDADLLDGQSSAYYTDIPSRLGYTPLNAASYTAADVLAKLLTVDGAGSGLDADLLDGQSSAYYLNAANLTGTLADARLSTNVALENVVNTFSVQQAYTGGLSASTSMAAHADGSGGLQVYAAGSGVTAGAAFMTFHRPGNYAAYIGLDTDNQWKVGGWSMGANAYTIWHAGNHTPGNYVLKAGDTMTGTLAGVHANFSGNVSSGQNFESATTAVVLAPTGAGAVYLRPNGAGSATGETTINSVGQMVVANNLTTLIGGVTARCDIGTWAVTAVSVTGVTSGGIWRDSDSRIRFINAGFDAGIDLTAGATKIYGHTTTAGNLWVGENSGTPHLRVQGSASGTDGGGFISVDNGASAAKIALGNRSALFGGAYDGTPTVYVGGSSMQFCVNGSTVTHIFYGDGTFAAGDISSARSSSPTTGYYYFGNSGVRYLGYNGTYYVLNGAGITIGGNVDADGDLRAVVAGKGLAIKEGSNAKMGVVSGTGPTWTVNTTAVTANSRIFLCEQDIPGGDSAFAMGVDSRIAGTSFVIRAGTGAAFANSKTIAWMIVEPS